MKKIYAGDILHPAIAYLNNHRVSCEICGTYRLRREYWLEFCPVCRAWIEVGNNFTRNARLLRRMH